MKKKALVTIALSSVMCAAAAVALAACGGGDAATKYRVTYSAGTGVTVTGTAPTEADHAKGEKFTLKNSTFECATHEFDGWTYGGNTYDAGAQFTMPENDVTFTAKWLELFTVTYQWGTELPAAHEGVELPAAQKVAEGKTLQLATVTPAAGYTFEGWKIGEATAATAGGTTYTVTGDVTLTAVFKQDVVTYGVTYSLGEHAAEGQTVPEMRSYAAGAEVTLETPPTAANGFVFTKWQVMQGDTPVAVDHNKFTMPAGEVTITAQYESAENVWTVSFYKEATDTAAYDKKNVTKGEKLVRLPENPTKTGYRFDKWYVMEDDAATETEFTTETAVTADMKVVASWVETVEVTYALGTHAAADATAPAKATVDKGGNVTLPGAPAAALGYEFAGWKVGDTESVLQANETYQDIRSSVTLTAQWTEKSYTIVFLPSESAAAEDGTRTTGVKSDKLGEVTDYPTNFTNSENFFVNGWAVKGNAGVTANAETLVGTLLNNAVDGTITLVPASYHLELGAKDHTNDYAIAAYSTTITKGEQVEVTGKMTSAAEQNYHSISATLWSGTDPVGAFRIDNYINDEANFTSGENWAAIEKDLSGINWDNLKTVIADCDVKVTFNWVNDSKIVVTLIATKDAITEKMVYTIAPASGKAFAESYKLGFGTDHAYADLTVLKRHTHAYGNDDVCTETGCGQVNPVHTAHNYVNGTCTVCDLVCEHTGATATCSTCGATLTTTARNESANLTGFSVNGLISNLTLQNNQDIIIKGTQTSTEASAWCSLILESTTAQITFRTDNYGWIFDKNTPQVDTTGYGTNPGNANQLTFSGNGGKLLKNNSPATLEWTDVTKIKNDCDWTVTLKLRDNKLTVEINMVGKAAEAQGWVYDVVYNFTLNSTPASGVVFTIGGEKANLTATSSTVVAYPAK